MPSDEQRILPFGPVHNSELFSNYWLEKRLSLEPEWISLRAEAERSLASLRDLWATQQNRVELYGDEAGLEEAFVQPVLALLGWKIKYQTFLQHREPDYALFLEDRDLDLSLAAGRTAHEFWNYPVALADAKAWHLSLDRPIRGVRREYPPEQIEWYLDRSRLNWAILTNGRLWRLIPRELPPGKPRFQTFFQVDLPALLAQFSSDGQQVFHEEHFRGFLYFFLLFGPHGLRTEEGRPDLLTRAVTGSSRYSVGVSEALKEAVFKALRLCIEGFLSLSENNLNPGHELELCRQESLIFLYRLLFIVYAEDRGLLPYRRNPVYTNNRSLARIRDEIATLTDRGGASAYSPQQTSIWSHLTDLFDLINRGHARYGVPAYNGGLFDPDKHPFLASMKISDFYLAQVLDKLSRATDPLHPDSGLFRVDYRDLAIQQLGGVYEGLLELEPHWATERMIVCRSESNPLEQIVPANFPLPRGLEPTQIIYLPRTVYLTRVKSERRATGSYYTPDHIVMEIINRTLRPLCIEIDTKLKAEIKAIEDQLNGLVSEANKPALEAELNLLKSSYANRVLQLRVLDPAMGSGHFLVRACHFLAEEIATNPCSPDDPQSVQSDEVMLLYWKRQVAERSIFGVDLNPMAVELAKLAIWLDTASTNKPLTFLDHHLRTGNSIVGGRISELGVLPEEAPLLQNDFAIQVRAQLDRLLQPLAQIDALPSDTEKDIKEKERIYRRTFLPVQESFLRVADVWCSTFFATTDMYLSEEDYESLIHAMPRQADFSRLLTTDPFASTLLLMNSPSLRPFHWEIEFPRVFFSTVEERFVPGFDAIIGNPPYDVLADLELGRDLSGLKNFIAADRALAPSKRGKNNLYKLFVARAFDILRNGGYLGFIVPMPLLGDDQALGVRKTLLENGRFTEIDSFPQKDDPNLRVFRDAKLSTTVFGYQKVTDNAAQRRPFRVRSHRGNTFDMEPTEVTLTKEEVGLYDPDNMPIVTCSQGDWDLITRMIRSGRCTKLGLLCPSYQGEVNETTDGRAACLSSDPNDGPEILRGANITLYAVRSASQGVRKFLRSDVYSELRSQSARANHVGLPRVGFQRSSPQNNFRRLIAAPLPLGDYCFDTVSYVPGAESHLAPNVLLGLLNSKLFDWYFRLGSTNSKVNEYQFANLPCPRFRAAEGAAERHILNNSLQYVAAGDIEGVIGVLRPTFQTPPFSQISANVIEVCVGEIVRLETARGDVPRVQRSHLAPESEVFQEIVDRVLFELVGFSDIERYGLEERLEEML